MHLLCAGVNYVFAVFCLSWLVYYISLYTVHILTVYKKEKSAKGTVRSMILSPSHLLNKKMTQEVEHTNT